ncbi:MAG: DUF2892 domain-containing protein [Parcubacteria group bacterium]|jgi:hypothetical protein
MQVNEGTMDRVFRAIAGLVVMYFAYSAFAGWGQVVGYIIGVMLLLTAATGYCMLYKFFGISTK